MRLGLFGGCFDPIHAGHVEPVKEARRLAGLDRVVYLPTGRPPHKPDGAVAPPHARLVMTELAILDEEGLYVSAHELTAERASYTVDTVEAFARRHPEAELHLVVGADALADLPGWHRGADLLRLVRLVVMRRPPNEETGSPAEPALELQAVIDAGRVLFVDNPLWRVSSSALREALGRGERPPDGLVPDRVLRYIAKYNLYR